jgi:hypothetical protein
MCRWWAAHRIWSKIQAKGFGENVSYLVACGNVGDFQVIGVYLVSNVMMLGFYVLGSSVEDRVS